MIVEKRLQHQTISLGRPDCLMIDLDFLADDKWTQLRHLLLTLGFA